MRVKPCFAMRSDVRASETTCLKERQVAIALSPPPEESLTRERTSCKD